MLHIKNIVIVVIVASGFSCTKYLEKKPLQDMAIPSSFSDIQALLDNQVYNGSGPGFSDLLTDDLVINDASWKTSPLDIKTNYVWDKEQLTPDQPWTTSYESIYNANFALDNLEKIYTEQANEVNKEEYNRLKGIALFYRSFMFYQLAQLFCKPFSPSAATDPGLVLRTTSDISISYQRATVQQTYDLIAGDLKTAASAMPPFDINIWRPCRASAYGELARVYLSMGDYVNAGLYADSCLLLYSTLLDYNTVTTLPNFDNNPEILFFSYEGYSPSSILNNPAKVSVDSNLYQSYQPNDLRTTLFFGTNNDTHYWKGSYAPKFGGYMIFDGIAVDEVYLIRSECRARANNKEGAMDDLNTLLRKRWKTGTYADLTAIDSTDAINEVLTERRKELAFRSLRWTDLRRFNVEGANITLTRKIDEVIYTLPPNDPRWVLYIPNVEINRSGIIQNVR